MILLDTSVLSLWLRRRREPGDAESAPVIEVRRLAARRGVDLRIPAIAFQEVLTGVRTDREFENLRAVLAGFPVEVAAVEDHLSAAVLSNGCRRVGVTASAIDCLIAAQSVRRGASLFTVDEDFAHMKKVIGLRLHTVTLQ